MRTGILFVLSLGLTTTAWATPLATDVEDAADHHVAAQGNYKGGLKHSWEWKFGTNKSSTNITGINAQGLLAAHRLTGLKEHESSALRAAKSLIKQYDRGWKRKRPHSQDIEFLAAAGFVIDAAKWFKVVTHNWTASRFVDHVIARRQASKSASFAGWDIASAIRAAVAIGEVTYARGLLARLLEKRAAWDRQDAASAAMLSRASLLWAISSLRARTALAPEQKRFATELLKTVVAAQDSRGGWLTADRKRFDTQTTAYAVLGLSRWSKGQRASHRGRRWLRGAASVDKKFFAGGRVWASRYELDGRPVSEYVSEVQSEALQALASGS